MLKNTAKKHLILKSVFCLIMIGFGSCKQDTKPQQEVSTIANLEYEIVAELGEGAIWNHQSKELYWIDIEAQLLHIYSPKTKKNRSLKVPSKIGTVVPYTKETAVIALQDGIYTINTKTGDLKLLSAVEADMPENRFNDGKCDPNGNLWVGSMHLQQKEFAANLYKVSEDGKHEKMIDSLLKFLKLLVLEME